jgi:hypothetical protein
MKKGFFTTLVLALITLVANAQIQTPALSPEAKIIQKVGLTDFEISYSRPSSRGRTVFGDLVPFGELWRTGANASTKISFGDDVSIAGNDLKKGTYALYTIPNKNEWTIIIHKNTSHWGTGDYKQEEDAFRFTVKPTEIKETVETMTINIANVGLGTADIELSWANTKVSFTVDTNVDDKVTASIAKTLAGPDMNAYYQAAAYNLAAGKDLKQAYEWMKIAMEKGAKEKFWMVRRKALIEAELGLYKEAIASAKLSLELAEKANNTDYIRMNQESIKEWEKKAK